MKWVEVKVDDAGVVVVTPKIQGTCEKDLKEAVGLQDVQVEGPVLPLEWPTGAPTRGRERS